MRDASQTRFLTIGILLVTVFVFWFAAVPKNAMGQETDDEVDTFDLVLIEADLEDTRQAMTIYDANEDGAIDKNEQDRLPWRDRTKDFDHNRDGRLSHLEIALRFARLRLKDDIVQMDRTVAKRNLSRYDLNRNGQMDPEEIERGWPEDPEEFDVNADGILTVRELTAQCAFMRGLRTELGIKGVDQGGAIKMLNRFDTDADRKLNGEEQKAAQLPLQAKDFDNNDDGLLSTIEIATMLAKRRMSAGLSLEDQAKARALMRILDTNGDGVIGAEEFDSAQARSRDPKELIAFDLNNDGQITGTEIEKKLAAARKSMGFSDQHAAQAARIVMRMDENRNGAIELSEASDGESPGRLSQQQLKAIDTNRDQKVTRDEIAKHLSQADKP